MGKAANDPRHGLSRPRLGGASHGHGRAHARRVVNLRADVEDGRGLWKCEARVENIGIGGARLCLLQADEQGQRDSVSPNDPVILSLAAPSLWDPLVLHGRVAWARRDEAEADEANGANQANGANEANETKGTLLLGVAFAAEHPRAVLALHNLVLALAYD